MNRSKLNDYLKLYERLETISDEDFFREFIKLTNKIYSENEVRTRFLKRESQKYFDLNKPGEHNQKEFNRLDKEYNIGLVVDPGYAYFWIEEYKRLYLKRDIRAQEIETFMRKDLLRYLNDLIYFYTSKEIRQDSPSLIEGEIKGLYKLYSKNNEYICECTLKDAEPIFSTFKRRTQEFGILKRLAEKHREWEFTESKRELKLSFVEIIDVVKNQEYCLTIPEWAKENADKSKFSMIKQKSIINSIRKNLKKRVSFICENIQGVSEDKNRQMAYFVFVI